MWLSTSTCIFIQLLIVYITTMVVTHCLSDEDGRASSYINHETVYAVFGAVHS